MAQVLYVSATILSSADANKAAEPVGEMSRPTYPPDSPLAVSLAAPRPRQHPQHLSAQPQDRPGDAANGGSGRDGQGQDEVGKTRRKPRHVGPLRLAFDLDNKGSVARDHLASERTFLAWLRTSLGLASVGIAITQLFRLPSNTTTQQSPTPTNSALPTETSLLSALASLASSNPTLAPLVSALEEQSARLSAAESSIQDSSKYKHLGKPIGGTFIALSIVFLLIGINRFFSAQTALMREPSQFPPSRRSVTFVSVCVLSIVVATFAAIITVQ
ncbi:hypothetical protein JCM10207_001833 [Rhodosporidiobolus poonsookiae]